MVQRAIEAATSTQEVEAIEAALKAGKLPDVLSKAHASATADGALPVEAAAGGGDGESAVPPTGGGVAMSDDSGDVATSQ